MEKDITIDINTDVNRKMKEMSRSKRAETIAAANHLKHIGKGEIPLELVGIPLYKMEKDLLSELILNMGRPGKKRSVDDVERAYIAVFWAKRL